MSQETDALLRSLLFQALLTQDADIILHTIKSMCNKDMIAAVEIEIQELKAKKERK